MCYRIQNHLNVSVSWGKDTPIRSQTAIALQEETKQMKYIYIYKIYTVYIEIFINEHTHTCIWIKYIHVICVCKLSREGNTHHQVSRSTQLPAVKMEPWSFWAMSLWIPPQIPSTWRIISVSKWLITMVSKSPTVTGVIPFPNGLNGL